jgi:general secretion pathway protein F
LSRASGGITVDQLIALSDEMAALVRTGVPLDRGLVAAGRDVRGRLGRLAGDVGGHLERGEELAEAIRSGGGSMPGFYRAVVEAGLRSGRLAKALEGLADYARRFAETRRAIGLALIYPVMVLLVGYGLFVGFIVWVVPRIASMAASLRVEGQGTVGAFVWLGNHLAYWTPIVPAAVLLVVIAWFRSGRAMTLRPGRLGGLLRLVPGMRSILALAQTADFADLLALMVEHGVPLDDAVGLAAEATGSPRLRAAASELAEATRRGEPLDRSIAGRRGLPPMLAWVLTTSGAGGALAPALRHAAAT